MYMSATFILYVQWGQSPLYSASFNGHQKCAELLIEAGANVDVTKEVSVTSCMYAHLRDHPSSYYNMAIELLPHHVLVLV